MKKVSVIVPVYNVGEYIDQCMESICGQTYRELEILVMYDESADDSLERLRCWSKRDKRIRLVINNERKGLGAARNKGLRMASGDYVVYVDSDDWLKEDFIETLYRAIEETGADYVSSIGYFEADSEKIEKTTTLPAGTYTGDLGRIMVLLGEAPVVWKKIFNREWLLKKRLFQPEIFSYEDWGYDIVLVPETKKIVLIPEIGVFYRRNHKDDLSHDTMIRILGDFRRTLEFGLEQARERGLLERYRLAIEAYIVHDVFWREQLAREAGNEEALRLLEGIRRDFLEERFGCRHLYDFKRHICMGSFALRWIVQSTTAPLKKLEHFAFSGLTAAMTRHEAVEVRHENRLRKRQVEQDISGAFLETIRHLTEKTILFIDFLEERNAILALQGGAYMTESEAYLGAGDTPPPERRIVSGTPEFMDLWRQACRELTVELGSKRELISVVLVRNRLSGRYGNMDSTREFDGAEEIRRYNAMFAGMEEDFLSRCTAAGVKVMELSLPEEGRFADEDFRHGCEPQYMNSALYIWLRYELYKKLRDGFPAQAARKREAGDGER